MKRTLLLAAAALGLLASGSLTSCQDYEPYDSEVLVKTSFEENFKQTFGEIDPSQTWDLTKVMQRTWKYDVNLSDITTRATDAGEDYTPGTLSDILSTTIVTSDITNANNNTNWKEAGWYEVQSATLDWMHEHLVEGRNNTSQGVPFTLHAPSNEFAIIPIYQGQAGLKWDLHLVDMTTNKDYNLWSKSDGIWMYQNNRWRQPDQSYANGHTINADRVISKPIIINGEGFGNNGVHGEFFLYLDITEGTDGGNYAAVGEAQCSYEGMMLALNCPIPEGLNTFTGQQQSFCMIVGCEDANLSGSDWDMNDVVFLIVGYPNIPDVVEHHHKRYLCEDLGNTYDFDFNDIVVDVRETSYVNVTLDDQGKQVRVETSLNQTATIEHICGSLPFQVTVGDYTFPLVTDPTNEDQTRYQLSEESVVGTRASEPLRGYNPEVSEVITGYNRNTNNISIKVAQDKESSSVLTEAFGTKVEEQDAARHIYRIDFPEPGDVPLIIAVDRFVSWMGEHQNIPEAWWKEGKFYDSSQPEDPNSWITAFPLEYDANGNPILEYETVHLFAEGEHLHEGQWNEIEGFWDEDPGHAHLVQAFDAGYDCLVIHFVLNQFVHTPVEVSGEYKLLTGEDELMRDATEYGPTSTLTIPLTPQDRSFILHENGLKILIHVNNDVYVSNITAAKSS